jgi:membrane protein
MGIAHARRFARGQMMQLITYLMGAQAASAVKPIIENNATSNQGYLATFISTIILLFSATGVFIELKGSMNTIWGVKPRQHMANPAKRAVLSFIRDRLLSLAMVFALGFLLVFCMLISGVFSALHHQIAQVGPWPLRLAGITISCAIEFAMFASLFKFLPDRPLKWRQVWHGALIAAILFGAGRFGLAVYFKYAGINTAYAAAGSLVAVITWIYYSCFSLFFGAEVTKVLSKQFRGDLAP